MASWEEQERESRDQAALELQGEVAAGLIRIAAALERLADVYLYVNDPEGEEGPAPAGDLPPGFRGMR